MNLSELSVKRPITTLMLILVIVIFGVVSLFRLPIDLLPSFEIPVAIVTSSYQGVGPEEMENLITRPLEEALATVGNIENISSISSEGQSIVIAQFSFGTNMDFATLEMREKIDLVKGFLPSDSTDPMVIKIDPNAEPIFQASLSGFEDLSISQNIAENIIKPRLERLEGVASVNISGGYENQVSIRVRDQQMQGYALSTDYLANIIRGENLNLPGGDVQRGNQSLNVRTMGEFKSIDEIKNLIIPLPSGATIPLSAVADVEITNTEANTLAKTNGQAAINISIQKQSATNTVQVANRIAREIELIQGENPDLDIAVLFNQAEYIQAAIDTVAKSAMLGGILAVIILFVFLKNIRSTFIISTAIPVSVISAFALLYFSGVTLNLMTLGGLALGVGMLVDNSIVVLENIYRYREEGHSKSQAAYLGAKEVAMAVTASTLTTVAVFLPIVFTEGITSTIFREMAITVTVSLFSSLLIALTLVPMLSSKFLKMEEDGKREFKIFKKLYGGFDYVYEKIEGFYKKILNFSIHRRFVVILLALAMLIVTIVSAANVGSEFLPETDEGQFNIRVSMPAGSSLSEVNDIVVQVEAELREIEEIQTVFSTIGSTGIMGMGGSSNATITSSLVDLNERSRSTQQVSQEARDRLSDIPGAEISISSFSSISFGAMGGGAISISIKGDDLNTLREISEDMKNIVNRVEGTREVESSMEKGIPEVQIRVDRNRASQYGLTAGQIASSVRGNLSGITASRFKYEGNEIDVVIRGDDRLSQSISNLEQMMISTPAGISIPLSQVADVFIERGPININRDGQVRVATVSSQISDRDLGSISDDILRELENYNMPSGYSYSMGGENQEMNDAFQDLQLVLILAIVLVYMILAAQFESFVNPFIIMLVVPLGISGGILGLVLTNTTLSLPSYIGLIVLTGIVVNNAIVLIDYILKLHKDGLGKNEAILKAGPIRLRPVLMTSLTTILGLLPLALAGGEGSEIEKPLAVAVIGGLMVSTVLTLIFIPVLYSLIYDGKNIIRRKVLRKDIKGIQ